MGKTESPSALLGERVRAAKASLSKECRYRARVGTEFGIMRIGWGVTPGLFPQRFPDHGLRRPVSLKKVRKERFAPGMRRQRPQQQKKNRLIFLDLEISHRTPLKRQKKKAPWKWSSKPLSFFEKARVATIKEADLCGMRGIDLWRVLLLSESSDLRSLSLSELSHLPFQKRELPASPGGGDILSDLSFNETSDGLFIPLQIQRLWELLRLLLFLRVLLLWLLLLWLLLFLFEWELLSLPQGYNYCRAEETWSNRGWVCLLSSNAKCAGALALMNVRCPYLPWKIHCGCKRFWGKPQTLPYCSSDCCLGR